MSSVERLALSTADPPDAGDEPDPAVAAALLGLWRAACEADGRPWSLARLGKQAGLPMSTLRRVLAQLEAAGLACVSLQDDGRGTAALSESGRELAREIFGAG